MFKIIATALLSFHGASSFLAPTHDARTMNMHSFKPATTLSNHNSNPAITRRKGTPTITSTTILHGTHETKCTSWSPQDLTQDNPGFLPIPNNDYIKMYESNPNLLWPVEFFVIAHRRIRRCCCQQQKGKERSCSSSTTHQNNNYETQILVRKSANGTSKYGVGTGVPATRWMMLSTATTAQQPQEPPSGYKFSEPRITFEASNFPEFPKRMDGIDPWTFAKIDICEDAFRSSTVDDTATADGTSGKLNDPELEDYARRIRDELSISLDKTIKEKNSMNSWESRTISVIKSVVDKENSLSAIQGTLRMSGLFAPKETTSSSSSATTNDEKKSTKQKIHHPRYVSFENAPHPSKLVQNTRIYTMFPQMPDPMPLPSTTSEELQLEISSRQARMAESGRDPHKDKYGRVFTHISTSNVSNTIHGVYFVLDASELPGLDDVPALDLFGTKTIEREWVSLTDLKVVESDGKTIGSVDTKPTFISGCIVRQLVKEGVIAVD